jgi:ABC-type spermidine/putrescine transport system permease subunit II
VIVTVSTVTLALVVGSLAAYALGRLKFRGRMFTSPGPVDDHVSAIAWGLYQMIVGAAVQPRD